MFKLEITYDPQTRRVQLTGPFDNVELIDIMLGYARRHADRVAHAQSAQSQSKLQVVRGAVNDRALRRGKN